MPADLRHASCAVAKHSNLGTTVRGASMLDVMAWLRANDPMGAGLPLANGGISAVPTLIASLEELAPCVAISLD